MSGPLWLPLIPRQKFQGWPEHEDARTVRYVEAADLFTAEHATDAHFAAYSLPGTPRRLTLAALALVPDGWPMVLFAVDVDHPWHGEEPATDEARAELAAKVAAWREGELVKRDALEAAHPGALSYDTRGGYRVVWRLPAPVVLRSLDDKEAWRAFYRRSLLYLFRAFGIEGDPACADVTRLYRLPHATREAGGAPERLPVRGDAGALGAWSYQPGHDLAADVATARELAARPGKPGRSWAPVLRALAPPADEGGASGGEAALRPEDQDEARLLKRAEGYLAGCRPSIAGQRGDDQLFAAAVAMVRGFCLGARVAEALLARDFNPRCSPPWPRDIIARKCRQAADRSTKAWGYLRDADGGEAGLRHKPSERRTRAAGPTTNGHRMTDDQGAAGAEQLHDQVNDVADELPFLPLETPRTLPGFPLGALPGEAAIFAQQLADSFEAPVDLPAVLALGAVASTCMRRYTAAPWGDWREPLNLYLVAALNPGESKSPVFRRVFEPLRELEDEAVKAWKDEQKRKAEEARKNEGGDKLEAFEKPAPQPQHFVDDATPESIAALLAEQGERLTLASDEGTAFAQMCGLYSKGGQANVSVYLQSHDGGRVTVNRRSKDPLQLRHPLMTMALAVQPTVIRELAKRPDLLGRGLWARFAYVFPASKIGTHTYEAPPVDPLVRDGWRALLRSMVAETMPKEPALLRFEPEAADRLRRAAVEIDRACLPGGKLSSLGGWASKLRGLLARLCGVLHVLGLALVGDNQPEQTLVSLETVERALQLGRYFTAHALYTFNVEMTLDPVEQAARAAWEVIQRKGLERVTPGRLGSWVKPLRKTADATAALEVLCERGCLVRDAAHKGLGKVYVVRQRESPPTSSDPVRPPSDQANTRKTPSTDHLPTSPTDHRERDTGEAQEPHVYPDRSDRSDGSEGGTNPEREAPAGSDERSDGRSDATSTPPPASVVTPASRPGVAPTTPTGPPTPAARPRMVEVVADIDDEPEVAE